MAAVRTLDYPFGGATRLLALALVVAPAAAAPLLLGEREVAVVCARTGVGPREGICTIERSTLTSTTRRLAPLPGVLRARLEGSQSGRVGVALVTPDGPVIVADELPTPSAERMVREVNAFLDDATARTVDARAVRGEGIVAFYGALMLALAVLAALAYRSAPRVRVELDEDMDAVRIVRALWPLRPRPRSIARGDVGDAVVEGIPDGAPVRFRVAIVRKDGTREPLTPGYHSGARAPHEAIAAEISAFAATSASPPETSGG